VAPFERQLRARRCCSALAWIESRSELALRERIEATLSMGPAPHPYRRIRADGEAFVLAVKEWRTRFAVAGREVRVLALHSGYRASQLKNCTPGEADALPLHREFVATFRD
jgi:hypothetical protein